MSEDEPEDYLSAAAAVVEAARELDEARIKVKAAQQASLRAFEEQRRAEEKLSQALEDLKKTSTGRNVKIP